MDTHIYIYIHIDIYIYTYIYIYIVVYVYHCNVYVSVYTQNVTFKVFGFEFDNGLLATAPAKA